MPDLFPTKSSQPIFIIGSSRSGTSILASVLGSSPDLCHFTEHPLVHRHMLSMVAHPQDIKQELFKLRKTMMSQSGVTYGQRILEKTPPNSLIAKHIADNIVDAKFVHIIRDGRDVAFSMLNHGWVSQELKADVNYWSKLLPKKFQLEWLKADLWERGVIRWALFVSKAQKVSCYGNRYWEIRYEKLCQNPHQNIAEILSFLEIPLFPGWQESSAQIKLSNNNWANKGLTQKQLKFYRRIVDEFDLPLN